MSEVPINRSFFKIKIRVGGGGLGGGCSRWEEEVQAEGVHGGGKSTIRGGRVKCLTSNHPDVLDQKYKEK